MTSATTGGIIGAAQANLSAGAEAPPFDASTLKAPLTADQSAAMYAWIENALSHGITGPSISSAQWASASDAQKIAEYGGLAGIYKVQNASIGAPSVPGLPSWLTILSDPKIWTRVAEFAIGALMLGIAANAAVKAGTSGSGAGIGKKIGTAAKVANPLSSPSRKLHSVSQYNNTRVPTNTVL